MFHHAATFARYMTSQVVPRPMGNVLRRHRPYSNFNAPTVRSLLPVASDKLWKGFFEAIERPDLLNHPDFQYQSAARQESRRLEPLIEEIFGTGRPPSGGGTVPAGVPCTVVRNFEGGIEDEQTSARNMSRK